MLNLDEQKECLQCKEIKSLDLFRLRKDRKWLNRESYCKACEKINFQKWYANNKPAQRQRDFVRNCAKFGLSADEYKKMVQKQKGKCAICRKPETCMRDGIIKNLAIDHCHSTGKIRGLLCNGCNTAVGLLKENLKTFQSAVDYLKKSKK